MFGAKYNKLLEYNPNRHWRTRISMLIGHCTMFLLLHHNKYNLL